MRFPGLDMSLAHAASAYKDIRLDPALYSEARDREIETQTAASESQREHDMKMFGMMVAAMRVANEAQPITINNIAASKSESAQHMESSGAGAQSARPSLEVMAEMFNTFFSSGFNRVCFFGACGMGLYIYWSYLDHKWHMAEVQRRIDSNIVLRMSQWLFDSPMMTRPNVAPQPTFRLFPSLW